MTILVIGYWTNQKVCAFEWGSRRKLALNFIGRGQVAFLRMSLLLNMEIAWLRQHAKRKTNITNMFFLLGTLFFQTQSEAAYPFRVMLKSFQSHVEILSESCWCWNHPKKYYIGHRTYEVPEAAKPQPKCLGFLCFFGGVLRGWTKSIPKKAWHFGGFCKGSLFEIWPQCFGECIYIYIYSYGYPWRSAWQGRAFLRSQSWKLDPLQGSNKLPRGHVMPSVQVFCATEALVCLLFFHESIYYILSHIIYACVHVF